MQELGSWNQFLKISNYLKTCSTSFPGAQCLILLSEFPSGGVEGQQLPQRRVQSPHRQMSSAFGKRPFVVDSSIGKSIRRQRVDYYLPETRGLGKIRSDWSGIWRFLLVWWKCSKMMVLMAAQFCEYIKRHWIVYIKWVDGMICDLYLNKAVFKSY